MHIGASVAVLTPDANDVIKFAYKLISFHLFMYIWLICLLAQSNCNIISNILKSYSVFGDRQPQHYGILMCV